MAVRPSPRTSRPGEAGCNVRCAFRNARAPRARLRRASEVSRRRAATVTQGKETRARPAPPSLGGWRDQGRFLEVLGRAVFVVDEGPRDAPPLLILHGFPTSSLDFRHVLAPLAARHRVIVHDHLGFGLSDKPLDYSYSLVEQAEVALAVWRALGVDHGHVLAHDYGTSVATELVARRERGGLPVALDALTLANGSVHLELAHLSLPQRLLRSRTLGPAFASLGSRTVFKLQLRRIFGRPDAVADAELDQAWEAIAWNDGKRRLAPISSYLDERMRFWNRWIGALTRLDRPTHVLWGRRDPIAVPAIAEALAAEIPGAALTWLDELGHYPMLEDPRRWADAVLGFEPGRRS